MTNKGNTALHTATSKGYKEIIELLTHQVNHNKLYGFINAKTTSGGTTSLHVAAKNGSLEIVKSLLAHGVIYDLENKKGETALDLTQDKHIADLLTLIKELFKDAKNGNAEIISKLASVESDEFLALTNVRNNCQNTLLQVITANKHKQIAGQLLELLRSSKITRSSGAETL